jgi:hypothetical protein
MCAPMLLTDAEEKDEDAVDFKVSPTLIVSYYNSHMLGAGYKIALQNVKTHRTNLPSAIKASQGIASRKLTHYGLN